MKRKLCLILSCILLLAAVIPTSVFASDVSLFNNNTSRNYTSFTITDSGEARVAYKYTSCEKGTNECHNRMLRRFIPKGKSIYDYTADDICFFADCINGLPRKILGYATPEELFDLHLDRIYAA